MEYSKQFAIEIDLEKMIDELSLVDVLAIIAGICNRKAEQVRDNWQDEDLAREWESASDAVMKVSKEFNV